VGGRENGEEAAVGGRVGGAARLLVHSDDAGEVSVHGNHRRGSADCPQQIGLIDACIVDNDVDALGTNDVNRSVNC
jgi:hypothetical protein